MTPEEKTLLTELYTQYYPGIYLYVYAHIKDAHTANDITSDTFALACEKLEQLKAHPNKTGWLYLTARNKIREVYRRLQSSDLPLDAHSEVQLPQSTSPFALKEMELTLSDTLNSEEYKRFQRYFIWGYSLQEVADMEGISKEAMSVRLTRLRQKLKGKL